MSLKSYHQHSSLLTLLIIISPLLLSLSVRCAPAASPHPFTGFFVMSHGGITINPETHDFGSEGGNRDGSREEAIRLHKAMESVAKAIVSSSPDFIILLTPHGFYSDDRYLFAMCPRMSGDAGSVWSNYTASITIAQEDTVRLYLDLRKTANPIDLLSLGVGHTPMPLTWGEVIPMYFISTAAQESSLPMPQVIYMGLPSTKNLVELEKLGRDMASSASNLWPGKKVAVVISGDLAHTHSKDPKAPYGFNEQSTPFDSYIKEWGQMDRSTSTETASRDLLMTKADAIAGPAGNCGFPGIVILHSMISELLVKEPSSTFKSKFYDYAAPTYFGMIVTSWVPE